LATKAETFYVIAASEIATMNFRLAAFILISGISMQVFAAVIGTNVPPPLLTASRIATLPAEQQVAWKNYLERSATQADADKNFFREEIKKNGVKTPTIPPATHGIKGISLGKSADWYRGVEARRIANIIVSFQTPAGGWSKNLDMTKFSRPPGESFAADNLPKKQAAADNDFSLEHSWNYVGTFDNDATTTQMRFLAKVISVNPTNSAPLRQSFLRGMDYIFNSQYPNGGWPQVWPLAGGYHDEITLNDGAMAHILQLLRDVANEQTEFAFVPQDIRPKASAAFQRGINCVLAAQVVTDGRRTIWCQQYDAVTLQPASARNYEMPSLASAESAELMGLLMQLPNPDSNVVAAVRAAAAWFEKTKIEEKVYKIVKGKGRELIDAPNATPLWARYYQIGTDKPIFGDRDKSIHNDVSEISRERRDGYGWYRDTPKRMLEHYARWSREHPQ
jgi:PelA/Pel-15E family pectate lyase